MRKWFKRFRRQEGQAMSEYGLLLALLAIFAVVALLILGPRLREVFQAISDYLGVRPG